MRKAQEILEQFGDGANWIFKQPDGTVWVSQYKASLSEYISAAKCETTARDSVIIFERPLNCIETKWVQQWEGNIWCLGAIEVEEFANVPWNKCLIKKTEKAIPYAKAVGCLGFFWNGDSMIDAQIGILASVKRNSLGQVVYSYECNGYEHFKPIKRHEVKFFED